MDIAHPRVRSMRRCSTGTGPYPLNSPWSSGYNFRASGAFYPGGLTRTNYCAPTRETGVGASYSACPVPQPLVNCGIRSTETRLPGRSIPVQNRLFLDKARVISSSSVHQGIDTPKRMEGICHSSEPDSHKFEKPDAGFVRRGVLHGRL